MTFYLKYRSTNFDEIDIQSVRETLKKIFSSKNYPHALLFAGPKGTGKTSAARIVAKVLNCEHPKTDGNPCDKCSQCLSISKGTNIDVIEMDAASHRGIEDVRALREAVKLSSVSANKKVYIIDEAHMLTTEASNAFLKTLEEPPSHVIFIFATTNPEKLIDTIRSRTTLVNFKRATSPEIVRSLDRIVKSEKLNADEEALSLIADRADGSFRDAIKVLEQLSLSKKKITTKSVEAVLNNDQSLDLNSFFKFLADKDAKGCLGIIKEANQNGQDIKNLYVLILNRLHSSLMAKNGLDGKEIELFDTSQTMALVELTNDAYTKMSYSYMESIPLEIAIIKWCGNIQAEETEVKKKPTEQSVASVVEIPNKVQNPEKLREVLSDIDDQVWRQVIEKVKIVNFALDALLRASRPLGIDGDQVNLGVYYTFHKEHLERDRNRLTLEVIISEVFGRKLQIKCVLCKPEEKTIPNAVVLTDPEIVLTKDKSDDIMSAAREIFG